MMVLFCTINSILADQLLPDGALKLNCVLKFIVPEFSLPC